MRFTLEERQGYIVRVDEDELHIITMSDAEGVGLRHKDKVELAFPGTQWTDGRRVEGTVVGTLSGVKDGEALAL